MYLGHFYSYGNIANGALKRRSTIRKNPKNVIIILKLQINFWDIPLKNTSMKFLPSIQMVSNNFPIVDGKKEIMEIVTFIGVPFSN